ncbi:ankyrin repeat domain-containing protein [Xinfangfangia sp. CPCC 101601]|uniref:Ankyrin repeat domain-containing protein n=1 Tax=Pseudogemmobacter lacusdianii TaxID=3069608 RepID=A0ABU0VZB0_9RHOB|nr:ankyrin repeat domain-containing protein [Xinfangfangia sp. CPCC 101601]MDQ2067084.1 ankyrin repeat domain-containing protein [Xinfangfangia sp. CPCC 101601]
MDHNGNTILHLAAENAADPLVIDQILKSAETPKLLVEKRNSSGNTPLHLVAETGESAEVLLQLLAWGANPNTLASPTDNWVGKKRGLTPLHMAATRKDDLREDMILALLAFGADTMVKDTKEGWTALHRALLDPNPTVLLMLLEGQFQQENLIDRAGSRLCQMCL